MRKMGEEGPFEEVIYALHREGGIQIYPELKVEDFS